MFRAWTCRGLFVLGIYAGLTALPHLEGIALAAPVPSEDAVAVAIGKFLKMLPDSEVSITLAGGGIVTFKDGSFYVRRGDVDDVVKHAGLTRTIKNPFNKTLAEDVLARPTQPHGLILEVGRLLAMSQGKTATVIVPGKRADGESDLVIDAKYKDKNRKFVANLYEGRNRDTLERRYFFDPGTISEGPRFRFGHMFTRSIFRKDKRPYARTDTVTTIFADGREKVTSIKLTNLLRWTPFSLFKQTWWTPRGVFRGMVRAPDEEPPEGWTRELSAEDAQKGPPQITKRRDEIHDAYASIQKAAVDLAAEKGFTINTAIVEGMMHVVATFEPDKIYQLHVANTDSWLHLGREKPIQHYRGLRKTGSDGAAVMKVIYQEWPGQDVTMEVPMFSAVDGNSKHLIAELRTEAMSNLVKILGYWGTADIVDRKDISHRSHGHGRRVPYRHFGKYTAPDRISIVDGDEEFHRLHRANGEPSKLHITNYHIEPEALLKESTQRIHVSPSYKLPHEIMVEHDAPELETIFESDGTESEQENSGTDSDNHAKWTRTSFLLKKRNREGFMTNHQLERLTIGREELSFHFGNGNEESIALRKKDRSKLWKVVTFVRQGRFRDGINLFNQIKASQAKDNTARVERRVTRGPKKGR